MSFPFLILPSLSVAPSPLSWGQKTQETNHLTAGLAQFHACSLWRAGIVTKDSSANSDSSVGSEGENYRTSPSHGCSYAKPVPWVQLQVPDLTGLWSTLGLLTWSCSKRNGHHPCGPWEEPSATDHSAWESSFFSPYSTDSVLGPAGKTLQQPILLKGHIQVPAYHIKHGLPPFNFPWT